MKKEIAELIGTFTMVFCGCGAMTVNEITGGSITHVGVAITWGLVVMAMIYAFGEISGAHFNPAVTVAFAFAKKFEWKNVPIYILFQVAGAFLAIAILFLLLDIFLFDKKTKWIRKVDLFNEEKSKKN